jgi:ribosome-associated translation inhibitor RaiA
MIDFFSPKGYVAATDRARTRLSRMLEAHGISAGRVSVAFTDENGPKGGVAMRCAIAVVLPRRPPIRAARSAATVGQALERTLDTLERAITQLRERGRDATRRPKKYYAAGRLLAAAGSEARP